MNLGCSTFHTKYFFIVAWALELQMGLLVAIGTLHWKQGSLFAGSGFFSFFGPHSQTLGRQGATQGDDLGIEGQLICLNAVSR